MGSRQLTVYRGCTPVFDAQFGTDNRSPSETIVDALSAAAGVDPVELPPLFDYVDPDALDALFDNHEGAADAETLLSFKVETWNVFVRADGRIRICDATQPTSPEPVFDSTPA